MGALPEHVRTEVEAAISAGRKIEAIKLYREAVPGTDLVDAKKAVEEMEAGLRREHPENFGPATAKTGCLGVVLCTASLAAGLVAVVVCRVAGN
jgi:hypothetical protein